MNIKYKKFKVMTVLLIIITLFNNCLILAYGEENTITISESQTKASKDSLNTDIIESDGENLDLKKDAYLKQIKIIINSQEYIIDINNEDTDYFFEVEPDIKSVVIERLIIDNQDAQYWETLGDYELNDNNTKINIWETLETQYQLFIIKSDIDSSDLNVDLENLMLELSTDNIQSEIDILISDIPKDISSDQIKIGIWSERGSKSSIKYYNIESIVDNSTILKVPISELDYECGNYNIEAQIADLNGNILKSITDNIVIEDISSTPIKVQEDKNGGSLVNISVDSIFSPAKLSEVKLRFYNDNDILKEIEMVTVNGIWNTRINTDELKKYTKLSLYVRDTRNVTKCVAEYNININSIIRNPIELQRTPQLQASVNSIENKIQIKLFDTQSQTDFNGIRFAVWSEYNGQDDLKWYNALKNQDGYWEASVNISDHQYDTGRYNIHAFQIDTMGDAQLLTTTEININSIVSDRIEVINQDNIAGTFQASVSNIMTPADVKIVRVAVWSEENGQDDLIWYTMEKKGDSWLADINIGNHGYVNGAYQIHLYITDSRGVTKCTDTKQVKVYSTLDNGKLDIWANSVHSQFSVRLSNARLDKNVKAVRFAVWSDVNGQDDLRWYTSNKTGVSTWESVISIVNHNNDTGKYNVHAYTLDVKGNSKLLQVGTVNIKGITSNKLEIKNQDNNKGTFQVWVNGIETPADISNARVAIWSEENGQDDLRWYNLKKNVDSWLANIDIGNHGYVNGPYQIHLYVTDTRGVTKCINTKRIIVNSTLEGLKLDIWANSVGSQFSVKLSDARLPENIKAIRFAVWSDINNQDDLRWYTATKVGTSTWESVISIINHKNDTGKYNIHVYTLDTKGNSTLLKTGNINIQGVSSNDIKIKNQDNNSGTFQIWVDGVKTPAQVSNIRAAVWSEAFGQDDLIWYNLKKSGNAYYIDVDSGNHGYTNGPYQIHIYVTDTRGVTKCVSTTRINVFSNSEDIKLSLWANSPQSQFSARIENVRFGNSVTAIKYAVWSNNNGQDDLKWYTANKISNNSWEQTFSIINHKNDTGIYNVHAYLQYSDGRMKCIRTGTILINGINSSKIWVYDNDTYKGRVGIKINNPISPAGIVNVQVAIWSNINGQDDLRWYSATKSGDDWIVYLDSSYHYYNEGLYSVHFYATDLRGVKTNVACIETSVSVSQEYKNNLAFKGIDVSRHQEGINWRNVKNSGIDFAMIRTGYGKDQGQEDPYFSFNVVQAKSNGLKVGAYHYSYADSVSRAIAEANYCLSIIRPYGSFEYPIAFDFEESSRKKAELKEENTAMVIAFCKTIKNAGYKPMLYSNANMLNYYIDTQQIINSGIDIWVAHYGVSKPNFNLNYTMWQYTSSGSVPGINGRVDLNYSYFNY